MSGAGQARRGPLVAALLTAALVGLAGCGGGTPAQPGRSAQPTPAAQPTTTVPDPPATARLPAAAGSVVWFVGPTPAGDRLYRERRATTDGGPDGVAPDPAGDAVRELLAGRPEDPDHHSDWPPGVTLRAPVTLVDGAVTVDLATPGPLPGPAGLALQQLVRTVQDTTGSTRPVRVLVDGRPASTLLGQDVSRPLTADDPLRVVALVQLDDPAEGAVVGSPVVVSGEAAVFEATLLWEVRDTAGRTVRSGSATTSEGQTFAPYRFAVPLDPGTYELVVSEDDPRGGEGRGPMTDSARITVR
ncbi:GerMN domain-containing protein [Pseudonocardia kujensis]|uniref:Gmad2 immunoglobulin-like domain-containing protein n=1 Tax=Pseudonocardia kujensis TaxID=1128675 RepID=UPI001E34CA12|nr:Gmad2 immunoglobulin-like domain-containing protein [Pseudonocardia kujensis]MCE0761541.1 GerMN domain-containing protein [Pseudonocardia kujensis]